jgi:hypothetical protein
LELKFTNHFKQGKKIVSSKISKSLLHQKEERKKIKLALLPQGLKSAQKKKEKKKRNYGMVKPLPIMF